MRGFTLQLFVCLGFSTYLLTIGLSNAQEAPVAKKKIEMVEPDPAPDGSPTIDGGDKQDVENWKATLKFFSGNNLLCTSTIVGIRVLIVAAHCIKDDIDYGIKFKTGAEYSLDCTRHPHHEAALSTNPDTLFSDVALCVTKKDLPTAGEFENVDLDSSRVKLNANLFLLGYGCRNVENTDIKFGQLYGGPARVFKLPPTSGGHIETKDGVVICPRDSGGAAYLWNGSAAPTGARSIIGVNSGYDAASRVSGIAAFTPTIVSWIRRWAEENEVKICGVDNDVGNCRTKYAP